MVGISYYAAEQVIAQWTERDLTAAALAGGLPPAFEVDDFLEQIGGVLGAGRVPVLSGETGVGKTSIIYELVRQGAEGLGPSTLKGKRVLQFSFRLRASALRNPGQNLRPEMQKLIRAGIVLRKAGAERSILRLPWSKLST